MDQRNRKNFFRNGRLMRQKIIYLWSMKIKMRRRKELLTDLLIKVIHMEMIGGLERWLKNLALSKPYGEWGDQRMVADPISLTPFLSSFLTGSGETKEWWLTPFLRGVGRPKNGG